MTKCYCKDYLVDNCKFCDPLNDVEQLSAEIHAIYQEEAKRQGDVRHVDNYSDLPENIKEFDRVLAKFILNKLAATERAADYQCNKCLLYYSDNNGESTRST